MKSVLAVPPDCHNGQASRPVNTKTAKNDRIEKREEEEEEEEEWNKPRRSRLWAEAPEPMGRRCFAAKEGLQPGGTEAFMTPRLFWRAAHDKS